MKTEIFGVLDSKQCHVDVSKTERGAKQYAALNGYDTVSLRHNAGYNVSIVSRKFGKQWYTYPDAPATIERYGTFLRIYDNGGKTTDRYTVIPPKSAIEYRGRFDWEAIGASESPYCPGGFGMHVGAVPGAHLGKRIHWNDLPSDVQKFARETFPEYAPKYDWECS